jgi:hypothetical protein
MKCELIPTKTYIKHDVMLTKQVLQKEDTCLFIGGKKIVHMIFLTFVNTMIFFQRHGLEVFAMLLTKEVIFST